MKRKKPELLAPAGNMEKLEMALRYGADAVYLGGEAYGLRAQGGNFTREELAEAARLAHARGKKIYVTVNVYPHNEELADLPEYLRFLQQAGVDAILVSDLGVFSIARETASELPVHISTQANTVNCAAAEAWARLGAERVVLAREVPLADIEEIRRRCGVELEIFVHGAMCVSYSGRCLMSNYFTGRDANRGNCAHACRWKYALMEETRPGQYFPVEEDGRGTYIFNSKDLCLMPYLAEVIESGVDSLKIEGRMKSVHYVASVTKAYRMAIDAYFNAPKDFSVDPAWMEELDKVSHRAYTDGFFHGGPPNDAQIYGSSSYTQTSEFVGLVLDYDESTGIALVEQRNHFRVGEELEIFQPKGAGWRQWLSEMTDEAGVRIAAAPHPQQRVRIRMERPIEKYAILRRDTKEE
ncbi:MAG: U32 family peptidase [Schwartzia sp.]|nr:U32 family peptidase [Schwartzia sp. (in: firmicutes)]MBR1885426.1 U32 family peptidase [Schwartzia sp. (in: firmicutes)]